MKSRQSISNRELTELIESGEGFRVEFKESAANTDKIRQAICAFANDRPGTGEPGIVVVGIKDDRTPADRPVTDELPVYLSSFKSDGTILPPPDLLVEKRRFRNHEIAVVTVWPSESPPVRYKGTVHVRSGPRNDIATAQDERILNERRQHQDAPFDIRPVPGTGIEDVDRLQFEHAYLPGAVHPEVIDNNERSYEERLASTKMIASPEDQRATVLGLLVLGVSPRDCIPCSYVQFLRIDGREMSDPIIDDQELSGTVTDIIRDLEDKLDAHNRRSVDFASTPREIRVCTYPAAALEQLFRNAVMHRTYEHTNAPVRFTWYDDRIEIINPGEPYGSASGEDFGKDGITDYRNPNLAEAMRNLGFVQKFGAGIPLARRLLREAGHPEIEFEQGRNHLRCTIRSAESPVVGSG